MTYILGAKSLAREVLAVYRALGRESEVRGFVEEPRLDDTVQLADRPILDEAALMAEGPSHHLVGGVGTPIRKTWFTRLLARGFEFDTVVHPRACVDSTCRIGKGNVLLGSLTLSCDVTTGDHVVIYPGSVLTHDVVIGAYVTVCPGVVVGGGVRIGEQSWLGIGATVKDGVEIGRGSFVGAGAVVIRDVPESALCYGNPGRTVRSIAPADWRGLVSTSKA